MLEDSGGRAAFVNPPSGFRWLVPGRLGGMARPGLVRTLEEDLRALAALRVTVLVSLEENPPARELISAHGISLEHLPVSAMGAPRVESALPMLLKIREHMRRGSACVYCCQGGLGRTNTLLAAHLVLDGVSVDDAIPTARKRSLVYEPLATEVAFLRTLAGLQTVAEPLR